MVSLGKLDDDKLQIHVKEGTLAIFNPEGHEIGQILKTNGLYQIPHKEFAYAVTKVKLISLYEAHCITGHLNYAYIKHMFNNDQITGYDLDRTQMEEPEC